MADRSATPPKERADPASGATEQPGNHAADQPIMQDEAPEATVQKPETDSGLPVEEQVRKEWDPNKDGGLPTFLRKTQQIKRR